jgi:uncharacterized protein YggE
MLGVYPDNPEITPPEKCRVDVCITVPEGAEPAGEVSLQTIIGGPLPGKRSARLTRRPPHPYGHAGMIPRAPPTAAAGERRGCTMARRSILPAILRVLPLLLIAACAGDQPAFDERRMTLGMQAAADTLVAPDQVVWAVTMQDADEQLQTAKQANDRKLGAVLAALEDLDRLPGSLSTGAARIERQVERCRDSAEQRVRYLVKRTVSFRQDDLAGAEATLDLLVSSAEVEVACHYEVSDPEAVLRDLRRRALDQARAKIASLAAHVGKTVGDLRGVRVNEQRYRNLYHDRRRMELTGVAGAEARFMETEVHATFEIR